MIAGVLAGAMRASGWNVAPAPFDFFDGKGVLESIARELALPKVQFKKLEAEEAPFLQPGRAAQMVAAGAEPSLVASMVYQRKSLAALQLESRVAQRARFACGGRLVVSWMDDSDLAELGATKDDCEELTDVVRQIDGPEVSVILRGMGTHIRGSIRSKTDYDAAAVAKTMNGGGHRAASGFTLYGPM